MVTIINYHLRQNKAGEDFVTLELQGEIELIQSMETGNFYATARRCSITSTFVENVAKTLIGTKLSGSIQRVACDKYDFTVPETGEIISLAHSYQYVPDQVNENITKKVMSLA